VTGPVAGRVIQADGRAKAYRPLPEPDRAAALRSGIDAYERGDFFEAHELLEPAWMGTSDPLERALIQGLIKLAAADVHGVRGNPRGVARNLEGALERLRLAADAGVATPDAIDLDALITAVTARLERAGRGQPTDPTTLPRSR
jgi:predicted metal-dependent hydrolase